MEKNKTKKSKVEETTVEPIKPALFDVHFVGTDPAISLKLGNVITKDECYMKQFTRKADKKKITKWILTDEAVQKLVDAGNLIKTEVSKPLMEPTPGNRHEYAVWVTVKCLSKLNEQGFCIHGQYEGKTAMLGEANDDNLRIGSGYPLIMAEKRGFHRAVIAHLKLDNVYSEEESEDFKETEATPIISPEEFAKVKPFVEKLMNATTTKSLNPIAREIKTKTKELSKAQYDYLKELYYTQRRRVDKAFTETKNNANGN